MSGHKPWSELKAERKSKIDHNPPDGVLEDLRGRLVGSDQYPGTVLYVAHERGHILYSHEVDELLQLAVTSTHDTAMERVDKLRELVNEQAEDEGLWFDAHFTSEAYLQEALRRLHAAIEGEHPVIGLMKRLEDSIDEAKERRTCPECGGTGDEPETAMDAQSNPCPTCKGSGKAGAGSSPKDGAP